MKVHSSLLSQLQPGQGGTPPRRTSRLANRRASTSVGPKMDTITMSRHALPPVRVHPERVQQTNDTEMADIDNTLPLTTNSYFAHMLEFNTGRIALGGHRGMGANVWGGNGAATGKSHRFRENTISSFLAAVQRGCKFIEFDVQVTADGVPVIFHDNYVVYGDQASPTSSLVKSMSVADFKGLAPIHSTNTTTSDIDGSVAGASDDEATSTAHYNPIASMSSGQLAPSVPSSSSRGASPPRGNSPIQGDSPRSLGKLLRKQRNAEPAMPFEPSLQVWEVATEDHLPTLMEVFAQIPEDVSFDIEVKMTTPNTIERTPPEEVERVVDATLAAVDAANCGSLGKLGRRAVMFSSFDPEVCAEIKSRRPEFSVMFLSGGEAEEHVDPRRTSIMAAIEFAIQTSLDGVIVDTEVLKTRTESISVAKRSGLHIMTYGLENDDPLWVQEQQRLGVHGVIVDDVERIVGAYASK